MNDNIIKMFIGGEEVVSNKEFTINEEMLSASSTILNNCYPASWEETKDYVSNFYYPKDYSKYILGKGNFTYGTDQYSILSISGETFMQFTTNIEKEWNSFNVYGDTYQKTSTQSANLFDESYYNDDSIYTQATYKYVKARILGNRTLYFKASLKEGKTIQTGAYICISESAGFPYVSGTKSVYAIIDGSITNNSADFTGVNELYINVYPNNLNVATIFDNYNLWVSTNNIDYEPFTPDMPSPDYPSELVNVGYENLFDINTATLNSALKWTDGTYYTENLSVASDFIKIEKGKSYISKYKMQIILFNKNKEYIGYYKNTTGQYNGFTISTDSKCDYVKVSFRSSVNNNVDFTTIGDIQLEKSSEIHSYITYGKYGIEVKNTGKNLLNIFENYTLGQSITNNGITYTVNKDGTITANGTATANSGLDIYPINSRKSIKKGTYTLSGSIGGTSSTYRIILGTDKEYFSINGGTTFTVNEDTSYYMTLRIYKGTTVNNLVFKPMIEKGTVATNYEEYKSNSTLFELDKPLRSLPNGVKDIAYIKNNILYVDRYVDSVVLNGSETWYRDRELTNTVRFYTAEILTNRAKQAQPILSNYFITATSVNNINNDDNESAYVLNTTQPVIRINKSIANTIATLKTWLSTHNTQVDYELAEPYTENLGTIDLPIAYNGVNNVCFYTGLGTDEDINYYWKNYDVLFAGIVKNSGNISLRPTDPKYCSLQILDYKTFLSESDTLDFVISDKTIAEAISMVVDAISGYGFILGTINISQADDVIGAYSTLNKTAYDVFQYLANISGSRWRARFVDSDTMAIDFYDPELLPRANDILYTQEYWKNNNIVDLTFSYGTRDYRNKQIILSDEVYGGIDYTEVLLSNGYGTNYITQNNIATINQITVNGVEAEVITQSEKDLGVDADFYYTPGKNVVESTNSYTAGTQIIIKYTPLVKGRQIVYNNEEVTRIATQTKTTGIISRYESRNDILSSDELENIAETYIKYKGKPEIILTLTTLNNDLFNIGEICYFNSPIADLAQDYMIKSKETSYISVAGETNLFYKYELTSSFNSEKAINYFDNQRNKSTGNIAEGESITRNIDINNSAMIIWENATITEIAVSVDGDNVLNSVLNSPFID